MEAVLGLLALLAGSGLGLDRRCDATQAEAGSVCCYRAPGDTLDLLLPTNQPIASPEYELRSGENVIFKIKRGQLSPQKGESSLKKRISYFLNNGTVRVTNLTMSDDAEYKFITYSNGELKTEQKIRLTIEEPVSPPFLLQTCLQGHRTVSCSPPALWINWTLDGHQLKDSYLLESSSRNITLRRGVSGNLSCTLSNHVSSASISQMVAPCEGLWFVNCTLTNGTDVSQWVWNQTLECIQLPTPTAAGPETSTPLGKVSSSAVPPSSTPLPPSSTALPPSTCTHCSPSSTQPPYVHAVTVAALAGGLLFLLLILGLAFRLYHTHRKKKEAITTDTHTDPQDVIYADIRISPKRSRREQVEMQVEYGEVKFPGSTPPAAATHPDQALYSEVHVGRRRPRC